MSRRKVTMLALLSALAALIVLIVVWFAVTQPEFSSSTSTTSAPINADRLKVHVRMLSATFVPRDYRHPENLDLAAAYIRKEFEQAKGVVKDQPYEMPCEKEGKTERNTYRNVIAAFGPETKERIVVGAHYDAFGEHPAADDNASGVAGLIELAYLLGKTSLPVRVELVAFTLEEPSAWADPRTSGGPGFFRTPYGGSAVHAASLKRQGVEVRVMFSLEMIGYFSDAENSQSYPIRILRLFYPSNGNYILIVGRIGEGWAVRQVKRAMRAASPLPAYSINASAAMEGIDWSDHYNYWKEGFPAVMITDTAFNRNKHYHTAQDTPDRLDYKRMAMVVQGVYAAVLSFASSLMGPRKIAAAGSQIWLSEGRTMRLLLTGVLAKTGMLAVVLVIKTLAFPEYAKRSGACHYRCIVSGDHVKSPSFSTSASSSRASRGGG